MPKFFVENVSGKQVHIIGADAKHISVLRHMPGDEIIVSDGKSDYICQIFSISKNRVIAEIISKSAIISEPCVKITLFQALNKADKMELVIQKAIELGAVAIVPVITSRSSPSPGANKALRWQRISESAAKQCGRGIIPHINDPVDFKTAVLMMNGLDESYVAYERENIGAKETFLTSTGDTVGILIGPEGGFTESEAEYFRTHNIRTFSLGKRILRTETAGFAAIICLMLLRGEL